MSQQQHELQSPLGGRGLATGNSRSVTSSQTGIHQRLAEIVQRNLEHPFKKPFAEHTLSAFDKAQAWLDEQSKPLIFDSCCGVGESSRIIAGRFPEHAVIAVDRSEVRLGKQQNAAVSEFNNLLYVRADLMDFWRLAEQAGWQLDYHFLLYPNPYPKPGQLQRRWHASPVYRALLNLGGELAVRSNWKTYIDEFVLALSLAGISSRTQEYQTDQPMSAFERKYWASGQTSWQCVANLSR